MNRFKGEKLRTLVFRKKISNSKSSKLKHWLSIEPELTMILNFEEKTEKVPNVLKNWQYRRLSLLGKITILKS